MSNDISQRRLNLLGDRPGSYAIARHVRMSATKVRRVVDLVRGMDVNDALITLRFAPQAASEPVYKVLASAIANAETTEALKADDLYVSTAFVDEGMTLRRIRPRAKGSASRIMKRGSHITIVVEPREDSLPEVKPTRSQKRAAKADAKAAAKPSKADATSSKAADEVETPEDVEIAEDVETTEDKEA